MSPDHAHVKRRRSRTAWPDPDEPPIAAATHEHSHRLPRSVKVALVGLMLAVFVLCLTLVGLLALIHNLTAYRDAEVARIDQRIDRGLCDLLDQLPASPVLDGPRHKYRCGPGLPDTPSSSSTPTAPPAAATASPAVAPTAAPAPHAGVSPRPTASPRTGQAAAPRSHRPATATIPATPTTTAPSAPPASASPPVPDPICTLLTVCLEVP